MPGNFGPHVEKQQYATMETESRRHTPALLTLLAIALAAYPSLQCSTEADPFTADVDAERLIVQAPGSPDGAEILRYNRVIPEEDTALTTESGGYFHPFNTPNGIRVTGLNPEDHLYHRGIFFGWIDMQGEQSADFWGWGRFAPRERRTIVNRSVSDVGADAEGAGFVSENDWMAGDTVMVRERLEAHVRQMKADSDSRANVLDLTYTLTPTADVTLAQRAFGGFVFRTRIDGEIRRIGPQGQVDLPAPSAVEPASNWPPQPWYAYTFDIPEIDSTFGGAVIDHPDNPPSTWHNVFTIGLLQPTIVAEGDVQLAADEPLTLRYRAVTFDGEVPTALLDRLAAEWGD